MDAERVAGHTRLIPAHAGKTTRRQSTARPSPAHPRSRGENIHRSRRIVQAGGSSPLTRGKRHAACPRRTEQRLIPAHAGKTAASSSARCPRSAHPRSRGENQGPASGVDHDSGSSPLTRGKRLRTTQQRCRFRLIPAHAGKTTRRPSTASPSPAHPRSRGENVDGQDDVVG